MSHRASHLCPLALLSLTPTVLVVGCSNDSDENPNDAAANERPDDGSGGESEGEGGAMDAGSGGQEQEGSGGRGDEITASGGSPSTGCDTNPERPTGEWVSEPTVLVGSSERSWSLRLPSNYDASIAYPVVFLFHGCGGETDILPIEEAADEQAIFVRGTADGSDECWSGLSEENEHFFVSMLERVSALGCVDPSKIFAVGYDSGADVVSRLGCTHAYLIDAVATVAGENVLPTNPICTGPIAAMLIHDENDPEDAFSEGEEVRDRLVEQNFCVVDGFAEPADPDPCVSYSGCGQPVIWCATEGQGHSRQDSFASHIWGFLSAL